MKKVELAKSICRRQGFRNLVRLAFLQQFAYFDDPVKRLRQYHKIRDRFNFWGRYSDADPFKVIFVDPNNVEFKNLTAQLGQYHRSFGRVIGGDWDLQKQPIEDIEEFQAFRTHFIEGVPWLETNCFKNIKNQLENGSDYRGVESITELEKSLKHYDILYDRISKAGYKNQSELLIDHPDETTVMNNDAIHPRLNEIGISIGRDGDMQHHYRGRHRLFIAKILDLDTIPVQVLIRHTQWQQIRDELRDIEDYSNLSSQQFYPHPDLNDLV